MKRKAFGKQDANQKGIVDALRRLPGVGVAVEHDDILVGYMGCTYWFEVKNPDTISKVTGKVRRNALKPSQNDLLDTWPGHYEVVTTLEEILASIGFVEADPEPCSQLNTWGYVDGLG